LRYNINTIIKITMAPVNASEKVDPEVNIERTKYILVSRQHNAG
jgi:hypothetical protein